MYPALGAAAGFGTQLYGNYQRKKALSDAIRAYEAQLNQVNGQQHTADMGQSRLLGRAGGVYQGNLNELIGQSDPNQLVGAYQGGAESSRSGIEQILAGLGRPVLSNANPAFQQTAAREAATNQARAGIETQAAAVPGGLNALGNHQQLASFNFNNSNKSLGTKIATAQRMYEYGNAVRQQALARAGNQHSADQAAAMQKGNTAMLLGALMMGASQVGGYNQANQPSNATIAGQQATQSQLGGIPYDRGLGGTDIYRDPGLA